MLVKNINQDFFLRIWEVMGGQAKQRASDLFYLGSYFAPDGVMDKMKLVLSFEKRLMLKIWTDSKQTELLYVDIGYYDEERLVKNTKSRFHIDSDKILLSKSTVQFEHQLITF